MAAAALWIYGLWALLAFGLRALVQVRRTGDTGFRGFHGTPGSAEWWAGVLFLVAAVAGVAAPLADLAGVAAPLGAFDGPALRAAAAVVAGFGVLATLAAQVSMGDSWRVGVDPSERTQLVTTGPFAVTRNPIFTAMLVTAAGLAGMVPNLLALGGFALLVLGLELQVRLVEEPYLLRVHGDAYSRYAAEVGRFLPGIGRLPSEQPTRSTR
jgi:protein-S-isoprenylcysteine O-methyltransferase Ste14